MRIHRYLALAALALPAPAMAGSGTVSVELPRQSGGTYRKPFLAVWIEDEAGRMVQMVSLLHDQAHLAHRWLPELRTWWREGGREMEIPADGVSSPTRSPGEHSFALGNLGALSPGSYAIVVEAARENGGRELVKVPFRLRPGKAASGEASGRRELGRVSIAIRP